MSTTSARRGVGGAKRALTRIVGIGAAMAVTAALAGCAATDAGADTQTTASRTLTLGVGLQLLDFDPYNGTNQNYVIAKTLYSNLIRYTPDLKPEPDLASNWQIADDHMSVTITLRRSGFSDGTPVTAADVVAGVKRAKDPKVGLTENGVSTFISSATALDDHTVRIDFSQPTNEDRVLDWMFFFPVVEASKNDPDKLKTQAAGSGPFQVASYSPGTELTLVPNPYYYDADKTRLDKIVYRFFDDQDSLVSALQSGDIDGTVWQEPRYDQQLKDAGYQVIDASPSAETMMFYLNPTMAPFNNPDCRKAVMRAIDRKKVLATVQGDSGQIVPGPFPPSSPAYDESLLNTVGYDPAAAKAGIARSCATTTATAPLTPSTGVPEGLTVIQANLAAVGFDLKLENMDQATFATVLRQGKVQAAMFPTVNPFRSAASLSTNRGFSGGKSNYWWFGRGVPQDYQNALKAVSAAITPEEITAANKQFNQALVNDSWATGLYAKIGRFALSQKVRGWAFSPANQLELGGVWLAR